ncbi:MAG TPA: alpha/beta hydrolase [Pyrinomonadaceae bacterium]|nr:alpha/beta hydrolase [Pyrinomonadaceae bacterium]
MIARLKNRSHGKGLGWLVLIVAFVVVLCAAAAYGVRWYHTFYHHVTHEELSHEVRHSTFQATIRNGPPLEFQLYQQENATNQPLVLFTSGDGGWSPFCADIAAHIAATGATVVGVDAKDFLVKFASPQNPISPDELTRDYDAMARVAMARPGVDAKAPLVLAGWSLGADYSVLVASQREFTYQVSRVVAISLPMYGELAWRPADAVIYITHKTPHEKVFDAHEYLKQLNQTPIVFLNATDDSTAPLRETQSLYEATPASKRLYTVKASGHHFEGGEQEFYRDLDQGLSLQQMADKSDKKLKEI